MNYETRRNHQQALTQWCFEQDAGYFLTLRLNNHSPVSLYKAERHLRHFDAIVDRRLLGPNWSRLPNELRTRFIAVPEGRMVGGGYENLHYHALLRLPRVMRRKEELHDLRLLMANAWKKCVPGGDLLLEPLGTDADRRRASSYACKRAWETSCLALENFVVGPMSRN